VLVHLAEWRPYKTGAKFRTKRTTKLGLKRPLFAYGKVLTGIPERSAASRSAQGFGLPGRRGIPPVFRAPHRSRPKMLSSTSSAASFDLGAPCHLLHQQCHQLSSDCRFFVRMYIFFFSFGRLFFGTRNKKTRFSIGR
jgi:hypothetical protein